MISILCPTRKRPDNVRRFITNLVSLATHPEDLDFCFYVDNDDLISTEIITKVVEEYRVKGIQVHTQVLIGERIFRTKMLNELYQIADHKLYLITGDDMVFHTKGWDIIALEEFYRFCPDRIGILYAADGYAHESFATHFFIHKDWATIQGFLIPPYFCTDYGDTWINEIADKIGRKFLSREIKLEHLHYLAGKAKFDQTYLEGVAQKKIDRPDLEYQKRSDEREEIARKLRDYIDAYRTN